MKTIRAILYTLFFSIELLALPIIITRYKEYFGIDKDSLIGFMTFSVFFCVFQAFLCGALWYSAMTGKPIKEMFK